MKVQNIPLTTGPGIPLSPSEPGLPGEPWGPTGPVFPWGPSKPGSPFTQTQNECKPVSACLFAGYLTLLVYSEWTELTNTTISSVCWMCYLSSFLSLSSLRPCCSRGTLFKNRYNKIDGRDEYCGTQLQHFITYNISQGQCSRQYHGTILTLFPGGPEGPDSPVGPGEPYLNISKGYKL